MILLTAVVCRYRLLFGRYFLLFSLVLAWPFSLFCQSAASPGADLSLEDFLRRVLERNESVQERVLELEINRRKFKAEYGVFEPELVGSFSRERNRRENTIEQQANLLNQQIFSELNNIYQAGLEALAPTGTRIRLGYTLRDLENSLQRVRNPPQTNGEYQTFFGFSLTQPLLKNAWFPANLAGIRIAALGSDIAFQDYRRQLMIIISTAEASYWNLYLAQEQVRFFQESLGTAGKIFNDNRSRLEAGKGSELEVLEAEAGVALRRSKLSEAEQKLYEAANRVMGLYSDTVLSTNHTVHATGRPEVNNRSLSFLEIWQRAFDSNPDYLMQRQKAIQEDVRVAYAWNQRLPQLDLKASYGLNGLGVTPSDSWDDIERSDFPSWSVGVELHIPLAGGIKSANELAAARLRRKQALLGIKEIETQIANALDTAMHKITSAQQSVDSYQTVVSFNQNLLDSALARLDVGKLESRKVLEIEADLFEAKNSQAEALVNYRRALLELEVLEGSLLSQRNLELSQKELQTKTAGLVSHGNLSEARYVNFIKQMQTEYENKTPLPVPQDTPAQKKAREQIYEQQSHWTRTNAPPVVVPQSPMPQPEKMEGTNRLPENVQPPPTPLNPELEEKMREMLRKKTQNPR